MVPVWVFLVLISPFWDVRVQMVCRGGQWGRPWVIIIIYWLVFITFLLGAAPLQVGWGTQMETEQSI